MLIKNYYDTLEDGVRDINLSNDVAVPEIEFWVEKILNKRIVEGQAWYFVKWKDYNDEENTWEPEENLYCKALIKEFNDNFKKTDEEITVILNKF